MALLLPCKQDGQESGFAGNVFYVQDGAQALDFIRKTSSYKEKSPPDLILQF